MTDHWLDYVAKGAGWSALGLFAVYLYLYAYTEPYTGGSGIMFFTILGLTGLALWARKGAKRQHPPRERNMGRL